MIKMTKNYAALKEQLKQKFAQSKKAAEARIKEAKEAYNTVKQKAQPKVDELISDFQYTVNPPKIEVLRKEVTSLEKKYLFKSSFLSEFEKRAPQQTYMIAQRRKELQELEQKTIAAREKYNKFAAQQAAMQQAFDRLNNVKQ